MCFKRMAWHTRIIVVKAFEPSSQFSGVSLSISLNRDWSLENVTPSISCVSLPSTGAVSPGSHNRSPLKAKRRHTRLLSAPGHTCPCLPLGEALPVVTMRISEDFFHTNQILMQFAVRIFRLMVFTQLNQMNILLTSFRTLGAAGTLPENKSSSFSLPDPSQRSNMVLLCTVSWKSCWF